jgi:aspartate racemase
MTLTHPQCKNFIFEYNISDNPRKQELLLLFVLPNLISLSAWPAQFSNRSLYPQAATMKTIGVIGGSTYVSTMEYYKLLNVGLNKRRGGHYTGEILISSIDFGRGLEYLDGQLWEEGGKYLNEKALALEKAGADFIILACNVWHISADGFMKDVKIPLLHILDPTADGIREKKLTKVALVGSRGTMASEFFVGEAKRRFGIDVIVPTAEEQVVIGDIIVNELAKDIFTDQSRSAYLEVFESLRHRGAEGVVLGCTEIPLLVKQSDMPDFPMFDTLTLHVEAAIIKTLEN